MRITNKHIAGFTLVELITVILLLGILSAVAIARSGSSSDFEPRMFTSTVAEQYRFAHGLSGSRYNDPVDFDVVASASGWQFISRSALTGEVRREEMTSDGLGITVQNGSSSLSLSAGSSLTIRFSPAGDIASANLNGLPLQVDLGIELQVAGDSMHQLCVYPTGYLRAGSCE